MAEQLMAASITSYKKKRHEGTKTQVTSFIEIDLLYPEHTDVLHVTYNRELKDENIKPTKNKTRNRDSYVRRKDWRRNHEVLQSQPNGL